MTNSTLGIFTVLLLVIIVLWKYSNLSINTKINAITNLKTNLHSSKIPKSSTFVKASPDLSINPVYTESPNIFTFSCTKTCPKQTYPEYTDKHRSVPLREQNYTKTADFPNVRWNMVPFSKVPKSRERPLTAMKFISRFHKKNGYWPTEEKNTERAERLVNNFWEKMDTQMKFLENQIDQTLKETLQVIPEIYHYVWLKCHDFTIVNQLSMLSLLRIILENTESKNRAKVVFHTDCLPDNDMFTKTVDLFKNRLIVQKLPDYRMITRITREVINKKIVRIEHVSDVYRLMILQKYGGIYLDSDVLMLKSHNRFLNCGGTDSKKFCNKTILGEQSRTDVANGFIISNKNSKLIARSGLQLMFVLRSKCCLSATFRF